MNKRLHTYKTNFQFSCERWENIFNNKRNFLLKFKEKE